MNKDDLSKDLRTFLGKLSLRKYEKISELEELKNSAISYFNERIDALYAKKNYVFEVLSERNHLKKLKVGVWKKIIKSDFLTILKYLISMPFIYGMIIPGLILHFFIEIYHQVTFRLYGIPLVDSSKFFIFDRRHLPYLNWLERFNCFYCSYYNALAAYVVEIVGRTERFWCPIKHARRIAIEHPHYEYFIDYSGSSDLRKEWSNLRKFNEFKK